MEHDMVDTGKNSSSGHPLVREQRQQFLLRKKVTFTVFTVLIALIFFCSLLEGLLHVFGFEFRVPRIAMRVHGKTLDPMFRNSERTWWEPIPGTGSFNEDGFVGPLIPSKRCPGVFRLAVLGDSCTQWGDPPYSETIRVQLTRKWGRPIEVLNAGVAGYTSYQGLSRLQRFVLSYRPDVVSVYFGWNDHWLWSTVPDRDLGPTPMQKLWIRWLEPFEVSRAVQGCFFLADLISNYTKGSGITTVPRVSLKEYRENLRQIVSVIRSIGAKPILVTAPTDLGPDPSNSALVLEKSQVSQSGQHMTPDGFHLHPKYVQATREVAHEESVLLVDTNAMFEGREDLMTKDHVHLSQNGMVVIANYLIEAIMQLETLP